MGIEPTNKGFADHLSNRCNWLHSKGLTLDTIFVGRSLGPSWRLVLLWLLMGTAFETGSFRRSPPQPESIPELAEEKGEELCHVHGVLTVVVAQVPADPAFTA